LALICIVPNLIDRFLSGWHYFGQISSDWEREIYASQKDALYGLIKWLALNLRQHDELIYNVISRVENRIDTE
jgi:hypothetical protein